MISDINSFIQNEDDYEYNKLLMNSYKNHMFGGKEKEEINKKKVTDFLNGSEKYENINNKNLLFYLCYLINPYTKSIFRSEINNYYNDKLNLISYSNIINKDIFSIKRILNNEFFEEMIDVINLIDKQEPDNQNVNYLYLTDNEYLDSDENKYFCKDENCSPYPRLDNINDGRIFCNEGYYDEYKNGNCVCVKHFDNIIDTIGKIISKEGRSFIGTLNASVIPDHQLDEVVRHLLKIKKHEVKRELTDEEISSITNSIKSSNKNDVIKRFIEGLKIDKDLKNVKKVKKMMGGMKYKYNAKDIFNMDINATKEINQIYTRLSKLSQYDICNMKKNNFIHYLLDDVLKFDKSEQKGGFRYKLDDPIPLTEYNSIDKSLLPNMDKNNMLDTAEGKTEVNPEYKKQQDDIDRINNNSIEYLLEKSYDFNLNYNSKIDINFNNDNLLQEKKKQPLFQTLNNVISSINNYSTAEKNYLSYFLTNKTLEGKEPDNEFFKDIWKFMIQKKKGLFSLGYKGIYKIMDFLLIFEQNLKILVFTIINKNFTSIDEKKEYLKNELIKCCSKERFTKDYRIYYDDEEQQLIEKYMDDFFKYFEIIFINPVVDKLVIDEKKFEFKSESNIVEQIYFIFYEFKEGNIKKLFLNQDGNFDEKRYNIIQNYIQNDLGWNIDKIGLTKENEDYYKYCIEKYKELTTKLQKITDSEKFSKNDLFDDKYNITYLLYYNFLYNISIECKIDLYKILQIKPTMVPNNFYCVFQNKVNNEFIIKDNFDRLNFEKDGTTNNVIIRIVKYIKMEDNEIFYTFDGENDLTIGINQAKCFYPLSLFFREGYFVNCNKTIYKINSIKKTDNGDIEFTIDTIGTKQWKEITIEDEKNCYNFNKKNKTEAETKNLQKKEYDNIVAYYDYTKFRWDILFIEYNDSNKTFSGKSIYYNSQYENINILFIDHISVALQVDPESNLINQLIKYVLDGNDNKYIGLQVNILTAIYSVKYFENITINDHLSKLVINYLENEIKKKKENEILKNLNHRDSNGNVIKKEIQEINITDCNYIIKYSIVKEFIKIILKNILMKPPINFFYDHLYYTDNIILFEDTLYNIGEDRLIGENILGIKKIFEFGSYKILHYILIKKNKIEKEIQELNNEKNEIEKKIQELNDKKKNTRIK